MTTHTAEFEQLRAEFCAHLAGKQQFFALALLSTCVLEMHDNLPALAGILVEKQPVLKVNSKLLSAPRCVQFFVLHHELRHIPQIVDIDAMQKMIDVTPLTLKGVKDSPKLRQQILNCVLDAALHEDLQVLYPGVLEQVNTFLRETTPMPEHEWESNRKQLIAMNLAEEDTELTESLVKQVIGGQQVSRYNTFKDFNQVAEGVGVEPFQIAPSYVAWLATWVDAQSGEGSGEGEAGQLDEHSFQEGAEGEAAESARRAVEQATVEARRMAHVAGTSCADIPREALVGKLADKTRRLLNAIRSRTAFLSKKNTDNRYTYNKVNRSFSETDLPGRIKTPKPTPQVILILDTSGSMFEQAVLDKLVSVAATLEGQGKLLATYCGDTEYSRVAVVGTKVKVVGGGGTSLYPADLAKMRAEVAGTRKVEFLYVTDEQCCGLQESKQTHKLHIVNISDIL